MKPIRLLAVGSALAVAAATPEAPAAPAAAKPPVIKIKAGRFGNVLATRGRLPLYYWTPEKRNHRIHCTGRCAVVWPPLLLARGATIPRRLPGFRGTFGVIQRPDGRRQVTYNRLPLYSYHDDPPGTVLCDNVDGWFVVRA